ALRRVEDVVAVLGRDAGLPVDVVIACAETADRSALAVVLRGLGHSWGLLKALMHLPRAAQPTPETLAAIHRLHADMGEPTARHDLPHARRLASEMGRADSCGIHDLYEEAVPADRPGMIVSDVKDLTSEALVRLRRCLDAMRGRDVPHLLLVHGNTARAEVQA